MQLYIYVAIFRLCMREREKEREPNAQNLTQGGRWSWVIQMVFTPAFIVLSCFILSELNMMQSEKPHQKNLILMWI